MVTEWNNSRVSFPGHNEYMSWFRRAHAEVAWANKPKRDELARLDSMRHLPVSDIIIEMGGSRSLSSTVMDWAALVPILKVAQYKLSPN